MMNVSPVLIRRANRNQASKRIAVPFDMHRLFIEQGYDFIDDIIWEQPEGAGWATGRGRRFAADRNPLQYKPVPVTEYILVYRKHTDKLIDWNIVLIQTEGWSPNRKSRTTMSVPTSGVSSQLTIHVTRRYFPSSWPKKSSATIRSKGMSFLIHLRELAL